MKHIQNITTLLLAMTLVLLLNACNTKTTQDETNTAGTSSPTTQTTGDTSATGSGAVTGGTTTADSGTTTLGGDSSNVTDGSSDSSTNDTINANTTTDSNNSTTGGTDNSTVAGGDNDNNTTIGGGIDDNNTTIPVDAIPPVITLNGEANITLEQDAVYTELGATALDAVDGNVPVSISGTVDTSRVGDYTVTYTATDSVGNKESLKRHIHVITKQVEDMGYLVESNETKAGNKSSTIQLSVNLIYDNDLPLFFVPFPKLDLHCISSDILST